MERKIVEQLLLGTRLNELCRELHVSKRRVVMTRPRRRKPATWTAAWRCRRTPRALPGDAGRPGTRSSATWRALEGHLPWIKERLEAGWHAVTIYEELPLPVPRSSFYRFLIRHRINHKGLSLRRVVPEILHAPGEALLIDWGYLWMVEEDGRRRKLWAFLGVLGYSRYMVVRLMTCCDQARPGNAGEDV